MGTLALFGSVGGHSTDTSTGTQYSLSLAPPHPVLLPDPFRLGSMLAVGGPGVHGNGVSAKCCALQGGSKVGRQLLRVRAKIEGQESIAPPASLTPNQLKTRASKSVQPPLRKLWVVTPSKPRNAPTTFICRSH